MKPVYTQEEWDERERRIETADAHATMLMALVAHYRDGLESIEGDWPCSENHREMARTVLSTAPGAVAPSESNSDPKEGG